MLNPGLAKITVNNGETFLEMPFRVAEVTKHCTEWRQPIQINVVGGA